MKSRAICSTFLLNKNTTLSDNIRIRLCVVHRKEFESLAFGSVDQRSIQLS